MKNKFIFLIIICSVLFLTFSCQTTTSLETKQKQVEEYVKKNNQKDKEIESTDNSNSELPNEVENILMPPGYSDKIIEDLKNGIKYSKPRVSIAKFSSNVTLDLNVDELKMDEMLQTALNKTGRFDFFNQLDYKTQIDQQKMFNSDDFNTTDKNGNTVADIGQTEAAAYMITCSITRATKEITDQYAFYKYKTQLSFNVNVTNLTTGTLYKSVQGEGISIVKLYVDDRGNVVKGPMALRSAKIYKDGAVYSMTGVDLSAQFADAVQSAINNCASQLENMFPLVGYCMGKYNETDKSIKVNLGSNQGFKNGDYVIILRAEEESDPFTGETFYETTPIASAQAHGVGDESTNVTIYKSKEEPKRGDFVVSISYNRGNIE